MSSKVDIYNEQKLLVLARLKTLNPDSKIILGGSKEVSVRQIIESVESGDEFGRKVVKIQMKMINLLASV